MRIPVVTPEQVRDTAMVLAKIKSKDHTFAKPDRVMAVSWAESFAHHRLGLEDLLAGVHMWFADPTRPRDRVLPADIIGMAREVRRDRIERDPVLKRQIEDRNDARNGLATVELPPASADARAQVLDMARRLAARKSVEGA